MLQPHNAITSIEFTLFPMVMLIIPLQLYNVSSPIEVTLPRMVILAIPVQP